VEEEGWFRWWGQVPVFIYVYENKWLITAEIEGQAIRKDAGLRRTNSTNRKMFSHWECGFPTLK
jgi:hypothetical protein